MKILCISILVLAWIGITAHAQKRTFLRLYTIAGNKFKKGYFVHTTDSSISRNNNTIEVLAVNIGFIKTKRSVGHDFLIGELAVAGSFSLAFAIVGAADNGGNDAARGTGFGFGLGSILGLPAGAIIAGNKKRTTFTINGILDEWHLQRKMIDLLPVRKQ